MALRQYLIAVIFLPCARVLQVMPDIERVIMPGMLHWHSPQFHAYFAGATSYPSILADMLTDALGCMGISWASAPVLTELEVRKHARRSCIWGGREFWDVQFLVS